MSPTRPNADLFLREVVFMSKPAPPYQSTIIVSEARKILGTTAKGLSDETIRKIVNQVEVLTDIVIAHISDSNLHSSIDI